MCVDGYSEPQSCVYCTQKDLVKYMKNLSVGIEILVSGWCHNLNCQVNVLLYAAWVLRTFNRTTTSHYIDEERNMYLLC